MNPIKYIRQQPALAAARVVNLTVAVLLPAVLVYIVARLALSRFVVRARRAISDADWSLSWLCVILSLLFYLILVTLYIVAIAPLSGIPSL